MKTAASAGLIAIGAIALASRRTSSDASGSVSGTSINRPDPSPLAGASRQELEAACERIALERGADPRVLATFCQIESNWVASALNNSGSDGANGGAWGLVQLLPRTALAIDDKYPTRWRQIDPVRAPFALVDYPEINLQLGASLIFDNALRTPAPPLSLAWLQDIAAMHNSGRRYDDAPTVTRTTYWLRFRGAYLRLGGEV